MNRNERTRNSNPILGKETRKERAKPNATYPLNPGARVAEMVKIEM